VRLREIVINGMADGMEIALARLSVKSYAKLARAETTYHCDVCGTKPGTRAQYVCPKCHKEFKSVTNLPHKYLDGSPLVKTKLTEKDETAVATLYWMSTEKFKKHADAVIGEYGVKPADKASERNLLRILAGTMLGGKVMIVKFNDTYEQRIALATVSESGRVLLREIMPANLAFISETMRVDPALMTDKIAADANVWISKNVPEADESVLTVDDWRAKNVEVPKSEAVADFEELIAPSKGSHITVKTEKGEPVKMERRKKLAAPELKLATSSPTTKRRMGKAID
jgi:hypothetical protein